MISESVQEQATLHALGLLDAGEAAAFEQELTANADLRAFVRELREAAANVAQAAEGEPSPTLKARVMERFAADGVGSTPPGKVVAGPWKTWLPWAMAATFMLCSGALELSREQLQRKYAALDRSVADTRSIVPRLNTMPPTPANALQQVAFCPLEPTQAAPPPLRAAVLWDAERREGKLRLHQLPPPAAGHDYQLWVLETGHKEAVSAGVVTVTDGQAIEVTFRPVPQGGTEPVTAFAISLERAGGSPTNQGPILFLGKL